MMRFTSFTDCVMSTFSSFVIVPSSFHSGTCSFQSYRSTCFSESRAAVSA